MSKITFAETTYALHPEESVLECLLREGIDYPNVCRAGICQSCLMKSTEGEVLPAWQAGLPETLKMQGYFLACLAKPATPLRVQPPQSVECETEAVLREINALNHNVLQLKLSVEDLMPWIPGQYITLTNTASISRSYSIANIPALDGYIELQIKINPQGAMGKWLISEAKAGDKVMLRGPFGHCFYHNPEQASYDLLLAGTGTGLAPLVAIIKSALVHHHSGRITLVHGGVTEGDIYYRHELEALAAAYPHFSYDPCVLKSQGNFPEASVDARALTHLTQPANTKAFVCGPKETTNRIKKHLFLAGIASSNIFCDLFV